MRFGETQLHVDPGPGALVRALAHVPPCNPRELDAIVLSHKHLDHSGDVNALIEAMTSGGFRRRGTVLAPDDAFDLDPVVLPYTQRFVEHTERLQPSSGPYAIGNVELWTSAPHLHEVKTYGLHLKHEGVCVSYMPCGRYADWLAADYARHRPDVLIINVLRYHDDMKVDHLTWDGAKQIVAEIRPRVAVFAHFGTKMLEADPARLAQELEDELGLRAIAAYDEFQLDVDTEVAGVAG